MFVFHSSLSPIPFSLVSPFLHSSHLFLSHTCKSYRTSLVCYWIVQKYLNFFLSRQRLRYDLIGLFSPKPRRRTRTQVYYLEMLYNSRIGYSHIERSGRVVVTNSCYILIGIYFTNINSQMLYSIYWHLHLSYKA